MVASIALAVMLVPAAGLKPCDDVCQAAQAAGLPAAATAAPEVVAEVRVHGNHLTPDEDVVKLSGLTLGAPFTATTIAEITARLRDTKRFESVTVLKRFASIADPSRIVVVIVVDDGPVRLEVPDDPKAPIRVVKRGGLHNLMFMPILGAEDGYGVTYGVRLAYVGFAGERSRASFPLSWGGLKRAGAEYDRTFDHGPITRVEVGSAIQRQKNPAFELNDDRTRFWGKAERAIGPVRIGGGVGSQWVSFGGLHDRFNSIGGTAVFDTRLDPLLPRNAVYASAEWNRLFFRSGGATNRTRLEGRGYVGLVGQTVLVLSAVREDASQPLPPYLKSLLGGWSNLRGFKAGAFTGDTLVAGSVELRIPLTSPVDVGKLGVSIFADTGAAYGKGLRFSDQARHTGIGGSVWMTLAAFRLSFAVAHGRGADTRISFGVGTSF
jgi:outer membrane protein assembly factor BamA